MIKLHIFNIPGVTRELRIIVIACFLFCIISITISFGLMLSYFASYDFTLLEATQTQIIPIMVIWGTIVTTAVVADIYYLIKYKENELIFRGVFIKGEPEHIAARHNRIFAVATSIALIGTGSGFLIPALNSLAA